MDMARKPAAGAIGVEATPQQRAAMLAIRMAQGDRLTVAETADWLGMSYQGARRLLTNLCGPGLPVHQYEDGRWGLLGYIY